MSCSKQSQIWDQTRCSGLCPAESCKSPSTETTWNVWPAWLFFRMKNFLYFLHFCPSCLVLSPGTTREDHGFSFLRDHLVGLKSCCVPKATSSPGSKALFPQLLLTGHAPAPRASWWSFADLTPVYQSCAGGPGTLPQDLGVIWALNSGG